MPDQEFDYVEDMEDPNFRSARPAPTPPEPLEEPEIPAPEPPPPPQPPAAEPEPDEPPVTEYKTEDGGYVRISKVNKKGYKYQLEVKPVEGNANYFYGNTMKEMLGELAKAQAHATAKIRQQNTEIKKLREPQAPARKGRELTPEETAKANELAKTDFAGAQEYIETIRTGLSKADREQAAQEAEARRFQEIQQVESDKFLKARPAFYPFDGGSNRFQIISWMCQKFLGRPASATGFATDQDSQELLVDESELIVKGFFTATNLCKAFDVLDSRGLLEKAPTPTPAPVVQPPPSVPPRIEPTPRPQAQPVRRVTGIRVSEAASEPSAQPTPTPDDLEKQVDEVMNDPKISDAEKQRLVYGKGGFLDRMRQES